METRDPLVQHRPERGRILLRDGTSAEIRPLSTLDRERLLAFLARQSRETLQHRFHGAVRVDQRLVDQVLALADASPRTALALVVTMGDLYAETVVALGSYARDPVGSTAELALLVDDAWQGRGLGTILLERLAMVAWRHGMTAFRAAMRRDNPAMAEVLAHSGFLTHTQSPLVGDEETVLVTIVPTATSLARFDDRDREATVASLVPLFCPRAVAVVGASRDPRKIGRRILDNLVRAGFEGRVWAVNPHTDHVGPIPAVPSPRELPPGIDLAVVAVPSEGVLPAMEGLAAAGVRAVVVVTAGFAEIGGAGQARQEALRHLAWHGGMRVVGPNCLGVLNTDPAVHLNASFAPTMPASGRLAMASQSGALGLALLDYAAAHGLGVSSFASTGNKVDVSGNDLLQYWEQDPATHVIVLYLESFGNPRRFAHIARRVSQKKPILLVKAARTQVGERAAASHTAALATQDAAVEALCQQTGVLRVETVEELFDIAAFLVRQPLPRGPRVAILTNAGGPAILAADALTAAGLEVPPPSDPLRSALATLLSAQASLGNPFDGTAGVTADQYRLVLRQLLADDTYDAVLAIYVPLTAADRPAFLAAIAEETAAARASGRSQPVLACVIEGAPPPVLDPGGGEVPVFAWPEAAARALAAGWRYQRWRSRPVGEVLHLPDRQEEAVRRILHHAATDAQGWMAPQDVFALLQAVGLPVIVPQMAATTEEAAALAAAVPGPVALKVVATGVVHKTEVGGVALGLRGSADVAEAARKMAARLAATAPALKLQGFLVQPMAPPGLECLVGLTVDPQFGPLVAFGLGGIWAEVIGDVALSVLPLTEVDAAEMLDAIRARGALAGARGRAPADRSALVDILRRVAWIGERLPEVVELDLNPVVVGSEGQGAWVVDARIRLSRV
ncbi:MAG: GNAT family N-acetyltransferase [Firmicutes bacterium]|nr:GNAT family N-acetyltransferase [Alicyclobacillaceae bacterium]MCL6496181.1 GNAT family N-acetyltransferase [Bacillota bacterium]